MNEPGFSELDFSHLKLTLGGGMAVQRSVAEKWKEVTGAPLIEAMALQASAHLRSMTSKSLVAMLVYQFRQRLFLSKMMMVTILLMEKMEKFVLRSQVMQGCYNRPEETTKVMTDDGYFRTGDIGHMNSDGFVKIVDRKKDMILVSGFNVYPNEVEDVVSSHPGVFESAALVFLMKNRRR